jgi:hypothetical protein
MFVDSFITHATGGSEMSKWVLTGIALAALALLVAAVAWAGPPAQGREPDTLSHVPYAKHATTVKQLVQDLVLAGGESVSAEDVVSFVSAKINGSGDEWGTESVFNTANTIDIAVSSLSATDFVVAYVDVVNSEYGTAITGTVSGGTVSWGAASVFNKATTDSIAVSALSSADFVVAYRDVGNSNYGTAITGTVGGGTLSWGAELVFNAGSTGLSAVSALSATEFVVAYQDWPNSEYGTARVGTVGGGAVSWGAESAFNMTTTTNIAVSALSATEFVVAYSDGGNSNYGTARVGTVGGGTVSWGAESVFNKATTDDIAVSALSSADLMFAYQDEGNLNRGTGIAGTVSGGTVSWGAKSVFNAAYTRYIAVSSLSATDFVVAYRDSGNASYGTARVGDYAAWPVVHTVYLPLVVRQYP